MIGLIMRFGTETIEIRVVGSTVVFRTTQFQRFTEIDGLKLDKSGVMKEFPDLEDNKDWKKIACDRFKNKMKEMKTEEERTKYVIKDLTKFGYVPMFIQKQGFRAKKL